MKKINSAQAQSKKAGGFTVQTNGAANKPKYQKPDFKSQLQKLKKQQQQNQKPAKPEQTTQRVEIDTANFNYTKPEPLKVGHWLIWKSVNDQLIVIRENKRPDERYYPFEFKDGFVFLVDKGNQHYAYFHDHQFQNFLEKYGIHRVIRKDPNGEYRGRNDVHRNTISKFLFATDGEFQVSETSQINLGTEPLVEMKNASTFVNIKDATFVVFEQIAYREDDPSIEPFNIRQLVSDYDIFSLEEEIAQACAYLDSGDDDAEAETAAANAAN